MKTITVRGLDTPLAERIKQKAKEEEKSVNQLILDTLKTSFGLNKKAGYTVQHHDMDHLFGRWTDKEFNKIRGKIESERKIDEEIWK